MRAFIASVVCVCALAAYGQFAPIDPYRFMSANLTNSLISWWRLEEGSGVSRVDSAGFYANLLSEVNNAIPNCPGLVVFPPSANAAAWNNTTPTGSLRFQSGDTNSLTTGDVSFSIAGWFNMTNKTARAFVSKYDSAATQAEYLLWYPGAADRYQFLVSSNGAGSGTTINATTHGSVSSNVWTFVAAGHDSANDLLWISVNGGTRDTLAYTAGVQAGTANFHIGGADTPAPYTYGGIDEVAFWKRALTAAEVLWLWNNGNGRTCCPPQ